MEKDKKINEGVQNISSHEASKKSLLQAIRDLPRGVKLAVAGTSFLLNNALTSCTSCTSSPDKVAAPKVAYMFEKHSIPHRDNVPEYFQKDLKVRHETLAPGVHVVRDAGLTFYIVQKEDVTIKIRYEKKVIWEKKKIAVKKGRKHAAPTYKKVSKTIKIAHTSTVGDFEKIRHKLMKLPEFAYLARKQYNRTISGNKTTSFNIPASSLIPGRLIPIPLKEEEREISVEDFANYAQEAIIEMKNDAFYGKHMKTLLTLTSEKKLIAAMLAFARSESTGEYTQFKHDIGNVEIHRWEDRYKVFSFTYFHILMEKNSDGILGPGREARKHLGLTEGQLYHPKNAAKLFLGYRIEKSNGHLEHYFPFTDHNIQEISRAYNGGGYKKNRYDEKLKANYAYIQQVIDKKIVHYHDKKLTLRDFDYCGIGKEGNLMYSLPVPQETPSMRELKKGITHYFNTHKDPACPAIDSSCIVRSDGAAISDKINPNSLTKVYIQVPHPKTNISPAIAAK